MARGFSGKPWMKDTLICFEKEKFEEGRFRVPTLEDVMSSYINDPIVPGRDIYVRFVPVSEVLEKYTQETES